MEVEGRDPDKDEFLQEFGEGYGYPDGPKSVDQIRASEFSRLEGLAHAPCSFALLPSFLPFPSFDLFNSPAPDGNDRPRLLGSRRRHAVLRAADGSGVPTADCERLWESSYPLPLC